MPFFLVMDLGSIYGTKSEFSPVQHASNSIKKVIGYFPQTIAQLLY